MVNLKASSILDPRPKTPQDPLELAERPSLEELRNGKILLYDNTKLEFANYMEIFRTLKNKLREMDIDNFFEYEETVRGKTTADFREMAEKFAREDYAAAVTALGDMGTSPATTVLTIELERVGIPSVYITSPPGSKVTRAVAQLRAGKLCLCPIDIYQASTKEEIASQVDDQFDFIIDSLTLPEDEINKCAQLSVDLDVPSPQKEINVEAEEPVDDEAKPGLFLEETLDKLDSLNIGDGLPVIPPTPERIENMLSYCPFDSEKVVAEEIGPSGKNIQVEDIANAAVMAGCNPEYMPVLITAFQAMSDKNYNFLQSVTTSHPGGNLVLVSGPIGDQLDIHGGQGCLGPGFRANATIGRAVNLVLINTSRSVPGISDLDCLASPSEYAYCFAEDPSLSPWSLVNEERFNRNTTTVYVLKAEPPTDVIEFLTDSAEDLIVSFEDSASSLGNNNAYITGPMVVVLTPDHARIFDKDGWDKDTIREYLHENVRWPREQVDGRGIVPVRPEGFDEMDKIPVTRSPEDIEVVVAGGRGGHSAIILPWALRSEAIVEPIKLPGGETAESIEDFAT